MGSKSRWPLAPQTYIYECFDTAKQCLQTLKENYFSSKLCTYPNCQSYKDIPKHEKNKPTKNHLYLGFLGKLIEYMPQGNEGVNQGRGTGRRARSWDSNRGKRWNPPKVRPGSLRGCGFYMVVWSLPVASVVLCRVCHPDPESQLLGAGRDGSSFSSWQLRKIKVHRVHYIKTEPGTESAPCWWTVELLLLTDPT